MIRSFNCQETRQIFETGQTRRWIDISRVAQRKLTLLHAARELRDLRSPPGNQLEALKDDRKGQYSIRINRQWRLCFVWTEDGPEGVEIVDYH